MFEYRIMHTFTVLAFLSSVVVMASCLSRTSVAARTNGTFLYFAYGSNLLDQRIHINNPSAVRKAHAKLQVNIFLLLFFSLIINVLQ